MGFSKPYWKLGAAALGMAFLAASLSHVPEDEYSKSLDDYVRDNHLNSRLATDAPHRNIRIYKNDRVFSYFRDSTRLGAHVFDDLRKAHQGRLKSATVASLMFVKNLIDSDDIYENVSTGMHAYTSTAIDEEDECFIRMPDHPGTLHRTLAKLMKLPEKDIEVPADWANIDPTELTLAHEIGHCPPGSLFANPLTKESAGDDNVVLFLRATNRATDVMPAVRIVGQYNAGPTTADDHASSLIVAAHAAGQPAPSLEDIAAANDRLSRLLDPILQRDLGADDRFVKIYKAFEQLIASGQLDNDPLALQSADLYTSAIRKVAGWKIPSLTPAQAQAQAPAAMLALK